MRVIFFTLITFEKQWMRLFFLFYTLCKVAERYKILFVEIG